MSKKFFLTLTVLLGVSLFLTGCPTEAEDGDSPPPGGPWYASLGNGLSEVDDTVTVTVDVPLTRPLSIPAGKTLRIASGKLTVESGGSITVGAGAALVVESSGTLDVTPANGVTVEEGAALTVESGGTLTATEADGVAVAVGAALVVETANDVIIGGGGLAAGVYADIGVVDDSDPPPSLADTLAAALNAVTASSADADGATVTLTGDPTISSGEVIVPLGVTLATDTYMLTIDGGTLTVKGTLDVDASGGVTVSSGTFQGGTSLARLIVADGATVPGSLAVGTYGWKNSAWTPINLDPIPSTALFRVEEINADESIALLKVYNTNWDTAAIWYAVDAAQLGILEAVYEPNKTGSTDNVSLDAAAIPTPSVTKTAVAYDATLSAAVLGLFQFTTDAEGDIEKIELTGTPPAANIVSSSPATTTNLIVIDIGKPDADNTGLPTFSIPLSEDTAGNKHGTLGVNGGSYGYIRLRVNQGASLIILADNHAYLTAETGEGEGHPCPTGWFNNGCVEVMAGGKLRDGAYQGFPLGAHAVILNRVGSYLGVGPEETHPDAITYAVAYNAYYKGWLISPDADASNVIDADPRIRWGEDAATAGYLEVRPGKLAISANVTAQKSLGLIYSVWFIGNTQVTIDIGAGYASFMGPTLFTQSESFRFYGNTGATILIKAGSILHTPFLTGVTADMGKGIFDSSDLTITISGTSTPGAYTNSITGYSSWTGHESKSQSLGG